jgi:uncharacterized cupredoxin-like copper-binding protein
MRLRAIGSCAIVVAGLAAALTSTAIAGAGPKGHSHVTFSAGAPGDPNKPFRVIEIVAKEGNGTMAYDPARIEVVQGEQIKFVIRNAGELDHEFMLDTIEANRKHAKEMEKNPEMEHDDPNGKRIVTRKEAELFWKFTKVGVFEYACMIPGHYEAGMKGAVEVKAKPKAPVAVASKAKPKPPQAAARANSTAQQ